MTIRDKAVPNIVGVDIGCGMYTVDLGKADIDFGKFDEAAHFVPSGMRVWEGRQGRFDLQELRCYRSLKDAKRIARSIGTPQAIYKWQRGTAMPTLDNMVVLSAVFTRKVSIMLKRF